MQREATGARIGHLRDVGAEVALKLHPDHYLPDELTQSDKTIVVRSYVNLHFIVITSALADLTDYFTCDLKFIGYRDDFIRLIARAKYL